MIYELAFYNRNFKINFDCTIKNIINYNLDKVQSEKRTNLASSDRKYFHYEYLL